MHYSGFFGQPLAGDAIPSGVSRPAYTGAGEPEGPGFAVLMAVFTHGPVQMYPVRRPAAFCRGPCRYACGGIAVSKAARNEENDGSEYLF